MESIGDRLRTAREANNFTLDQVARETHVAKRFLKALEDEDFAVFPGETYALGFLRSYAEYLGLGAEELVARYRNLKIQEQPVPMTELLEPRTQARMIPIVLIVAAAVVALGVGGWFLVKALAPKASATPLAGGGDKTSRIAAEEFLFQDEVRTRWFKQGDVIVVPAGQKNWRIEVLSIGDSNLTLRIPGGTEVLGLGKERLIDLNGDQNAEIKVVMNDTDASSREKRVNLGLYKAAGVAAAPAADTAGQKETPVMPAVPAVAPIRKISFKPVSIPRTSTENRFSADFVFLNYCFFRYQADGRDREERFFQKGETFSLDARENMTLWFSNAGAVKAKLDGKDVDLGGSGEVAVRRIVWKKDGAASQLEVSALY